VQGSSASKNIQNSRVEEIMLISKGPCSRKQMPFVSFRY